MQNQESFEAEFTDLFGRARLRARRVLGSDAAAEDVAAQALERAFVRWGELGEVPYRDRWVSQVAANLAIDEARRSAPVVDEHPVLCDLEGEVLLRLEVVDALRTLPRRQREVVLLRHMLGLGQEETAEVLGVSLNSVKTHLRRARRALRDRLGPGLDDILLRDAGLAWERFELEMDGRLGPNLELPPPRERPLTDVPLGLLRDLGYVDGYIRNWETGDGTGVAVIAFELESEEGAERLHRTYIPFALSLPHTHPLHIDPVPGALGMWWQNPGCPSWLTLLTFPYGRFLVWVAAEAPSRDEVVNVTRRVALLQRTKLKRVP